LPPHRVEAPRHGRGIRAEHGSNNRDGGSALRPRRHGGPILEAPPRYRKDRVVVLSGGVGGARMARGFARILGSDDLTVVVNVGDDAEIYGVHVAADLDTVLYTLAGREGPEGWGVRDDSFETMAALHRLGIDATFRLGDSDLALCLWRTAQLRSGRPLSAVTAELAGRLGVTHVLVPATDDMLRTEIRVMGGEWLQFQEYFVIRGHRDEVTGVRFQGADAALPAPGVVDAISAASVVVVAPSNPPLSIWPILAVPAIRAAVAAHPQVVAVSPLIAGKALKGPAAQVMRDLGLPPGNAGVLSAYDGLLRRLVVDVADEPDIGHLGGTVELLAAGTRISNPDAAARLAAEILDRR